MTATCVRRAAHVAAGEDGCAAGVVLDRYDARFLSTEWAGGFVGCMAGVPVDERDTVTSNADVTNADEPSAVEARPSRW